MLAKHSESQISEGFLVVPLDCEWVWHCHRLNPVSFLTELHTSWLGNVKLLNSFLGFLIQVRYKVDCEELYGKILDNSNVVSSIQGACKGQTEEIWNNLYPEEPYEFDLTKATSEDSVAELSGLEKYTKYDLVSAVRRQSPFFYQVWR